MTQVSLNGLHACPSHHQITRARVPEVVEVEILDPGLLQGRLPSPLHVLQRLSICPGEDILASVPGDLPQQLQEVAIQDLDVPLASLLLLGKTENPPVEVYLIPSKAQEVPFPQSSEQGAADDPLQVGRASGQEALDLVLSQVSVTGL